MQRFKLMEMGLRFAKASITLAKAFSNSITAQNTILVNRTGSTQTAFQATLSGVTKVDIKDGGAATFAGTVKSGALDLSNTSAAGIEVRSTGEILLQVTIFSGQSQLSMVAWETLKMSISLVMVMPRLKENLMLGKLILAQKSPDLVKQQQVLLVT